MTGPDKPGVSSVLFAVLARQEVHLLDVEQVVIRGRLVLGVLVNAHHDPEGLQEAVEQAMASVGMQVDVEVGAGLVVTGPARVHARAGRARPADHRARVHRGRAEAGRARRQHRRHHPRRRLPGDRPGTARVGADGRFGRRRCARYWPTWPPDVGLDIAFERAGLARRAKRLIVFDVDSTLVQGEVIEMLAAHGRARGRGAGDHRGGHARRTGLRPSRCAAGCPCWPGLPESVLDEVAGKLRLTSGARTTIRTLKRLGFRCGVVSGGFSSVIKRLVDELGLDFAAANELEVVDGKLTGRVVGPIVDRPGKAEALRRFAEEVGVPLAQCVAVGDGANDIDMISAAGLGVAFNAKPALREVADTALSHPFLDAVLFVLGVTRAEVEAADMADGMEPTRL